MVLVDIEELPLAHRFSRGVCLIRGGGQEEGFVQSCTEFLRVAKAANRRQLCPARWIFHEGHGQQQQPCGYKIEQAGFNK